MYHYNVKRIARKNFECVNQKEYDAILKIASQTFSTVSGEIMASAESVTTSRRCASCWNV
jgi:hypothetical protein